ncbi:MAG TPA: hypothetical protein VNC61_13190 [Acidimicrobiales bacterium]|nr:hypothetical protein [Acidimicrobiales bacterium]
MEGTEEEGLAEPAGGPGDSDSSTSDIDARMERLLRILLWVGDADVARGLRSLSVAEIDKQPLAIRTAMRTLRRKRDPATVLTQPQYRPTVPLVAEAVSEDCVDAVVTALGDAADEPDRQQLLDAIEQIRDRFPARAIALMLAYVSVTDMAASDLCDEILESDPTFTVPPSVV